VRNARCRRDRLQRPIIFEVRLEQVESIKGAFSGLSRKPRQFVHTRRIRQIACKVLRQIICKVTPDPNDLIRMEPEQLGATLLFSLLKKRKFPSDMFLLPNLFHELWEQSLLPNQQPPYSRGLRPAIDAAITEAWAWLESERLIVPADDANGRNGWRRLSRQAQRVENIAELAKSVGPQVLPREMAVIAESRLAEVRQLASTEFDFKKLVRLCEEMNTAYAQGCCFATIMLTRALLDHVPPVFGKNTFTEVANNYSDGGKSFKECMQHLENAARKVADAHLHMPIRKSETLPVPQQVYFAAQLDVLLSEIVRITR